VTLYAKWLTPYQDWAGTHTGGTPGFYADPNEDGVSNGLAWMLDGAGTTNSLDALPTSSISGGYLRLHFTRVHDLGVAALYVEYSATLGAWTAVRIPIGSANPIDGTDIVVTVTPIGETGYDTVEVAIPTGHAEGQKLFARLLAYEVAPQ